MMGRVLNYLTYLCCLIYEMDDIAINFLVIILICEGNMLVINFLFCSLLNMRCSDCSSMVMLVIIYNNQGYFAVCCKINLGTWHSLRVIELLLMKQIVLKYIMSFIHLWPFVEPQNHAYSLYNFFLASLKLILYFFLYDYSAYLSLFTGTQLYESQVMPVSSLYYFASEVEFQHHVWPEL